MTIPLSRPVRDADAPRTYQVRIDKVQVRHTKKSSRYVARWVVGDRPKSLSFSTWELAESFRSDLRQAAKAGEDFDLHTGLPSSMTIAPPLTLLELAHAYILLLWPASAPRTRETEVYALLHVLTSAVTDHPNPPPADVLRSALREYLLPEDRRSGLTGPQEKAMHWLHAASLPVAEMARPKVLRSTVEALAVNTDGKRAAPNTAKRRYATFRRLLDNAVERDLLRRNPLEKIKVTVPLTLQAVDPRMVVNPSQARELLDAVSRVGSTRGKRMRALFACIYYAALRPEEAAGLRLANCSLPEVGWGTIMLDEARPQATKRWTDSGSTRECRPLKHRARKDVRSIPIPPELVSMLREHIATYGTAKDGRILCTSTGNSYTNSSCSRVWAEARRLALTPQQQGALLAARPYDLRHAAVSLWLNSGVPAVEVAKRAGHGLDVLLKVYAKCIDGDQSENNSRIEEALKS